jgi:hypothetical protein
MSYNRREREATWTVLISSDRHRQDTNVGSHCELSWIYSGGSSKYTHCFDFQKMPQEIQGKCHGGETGEGNLQSCLEILWGPVVLMYLGYHTLFQRARFGSELRLLSNTSPILGWEQRNQVDNGCGWKELAVRTRSLIIDDSSRPRGCVTRASC